MIQIQELIPYKVTKSSTNHTFLINDIVWKPPNGMVNLVQTKGFLLPDELVGKTANFECVPCNEYEVIKTTGGECCKKKSN